MVAKIEDILENEGVIHSVISAELDYPCEPFTPDYTLLVDASAWEDIGYDPDATQERDDHLFRIRADDTDKKLHYYLAYLIATSDFSLRGVYITSLVISRNPANYTAWAYRMDCAESLELSLESELDFARKIAYESPKSYQPWQYRRTLCDKRNDLHNELDYIKYEISSSPKNHCAWSHLTWMVVHFPLSKEQASKEMEFVEFLLSDDIYNNTAWVYKNILFEKYGHFYDSSADASSCADAMRKLLQSPWNESIVNYLINALQRLEKSSNVCLRMDSCETSCNGGAYMCALRSIEALGKVTTPLLWLQSSITKNPEDKARLHKQLEVNDPIRF